MKEKEIVKLIRSLDESERDAIYQIMKSIIGNGKSRVIIYSAFFEFIFFIVSIISF